MFVFFGDICRGRRFLWVYMVISLVHIIHVRPLVNILHRENKHQPSILSPSHQEDYVNLSLIQEMPFGLKLMI